MNHGRKLGLTDFLDGQNYLLVIVDSDLSNYPEMALLSNTSAACVTTHIKSIFARHDIPQVVYSDNGLCYSDKDFQKFIEEYGFQHQAAVEWKGREMSTHSETATQESSEQPIGSLFSSAELTCLSTSTLLILNPPL